MIRLDLLERASLGPWLQLTLRWPEGHAAPSPGQCLRVDDHTTLWPMRAPQAGRLTTLSRALDDTSDLPMLRLEGDPIALPEDMTLILAEGLGLAPLIHLCEQTRTSGSRLLAFYETTETMPFRPRPSRFMIEGAPDGVIAAIPLLEDWGIPSRLASPSGLPGCHDGGLDTLIARLPNHVGNNAIAMGSTAFIARMRAVLPTFIPIETGV